MPIPVQAQCRLCGRVRQRFEEPDVEADYRVWRAHRAVPFARVAMYASILGWGAATVAAMLEAPELSRPLLIGFVGLILPFAGVVLRVAALERGIVLASALVNGTAGIVATLIARHAGLQMDGSGYPDVSTVVVVLFVYYGCTIIRLPPVVATFTVTPYVLLQQWFLLHSYPADDSRRTLMSVLLWVAVVSGVWLSAALERVWRQSFQQERLIEGQQVVIQQERERAELLLQNILPEDIATQLKARPGTVAESHDEVTVVFADLCGFTPLAAELSATQVVELLNEVFSRFDELCAEHGVEKIKTIGDAYMAVAGVPQPRADHAEACADLALAMRAEVGKLAAQLGRPMDFRIGMHMGPVIAGVIGSSKFAYDLWGDTVNTAARMEAHGVPGQIQVTAELADRLRSRGYELRERGPVDVKGKGVLTTWLLDG